MDTARASPDLVLRLCGEAGLYSSTGERISLSRKAFALLAYLELEPRQHTRQHLSALLWSESDEEKASMSLRQALTKLREVVGSRLLTDRSFVSIAGDGELQLTCDVTEFSILVENDPLGATETDVGSFLSQLTVTEAPEFEHWMDRTRSRLVRQAVDALKSAAQECIAKRDWSRAAQIGERWMALDPLSQAGTSVAIEAAFMRRDVETGRALFASFCDRRREAEQSPAGEAMKSMMQRLESLAAVMTPIHGSPAVSKQSNEQPPAPIVLHTSLQEREAQWQAISAAYEAAERDHRARTVVIRGRSGCGRTRLLQDSVAWMASRGATVLSAQLAESGMPLPYLAVGALVRTGIDVPGLGGVDGVYLKELMQLVPELASRFPGVARGSAASGTPGWNLLEALVQALRAMTEDATVVLAIDDAVWCDRESAGVLQSAIEQLDQDPVVWMFTIADEEIQDAVSTLPAFAQNRATVVEVLPLSPDAVAGMMHEFAGAEHGWESVACSLHAISHGAPGEVQRALEMLLASENGDWERIRNGEVPIPSLSERKARRIEMLTEMEREVLLGLALVAEDGHPLSATAWAELPPLTPHLISNVHGISRLRAARVGASLVESGLAVVADGGFRCAAPIIANHMFTNGSSIMRDELRRRLRHVRRKQDSQRDVAAISL